MRLYRSISASHVFSLIVGVMIDLFEIAWLYMLMFRLFTFFFCSLVLIHMAALNEMKI